MQMGVEEVKAGMDRVELAMRNCLYQDIIQVIHIEVKYCCYLLD
jgi:hypothetical protein